MKADYRFMEPFVELSLDYCCVTVS